MNTGKVTANQTCLDSDYYARFIAGKTSLVAQGGGQRGIFTSGVLDSFLLANFDPFSEFYGTSAGALNLCAYLCRQHGLGKSFILDLTTSSEFFNLFGYIRRKQYLDMDWAMEKIQQYPYKLDIDLGKRSLGNRKAWAAATSTGDLKDHYFNIFESNWVDVLTASCAIPRLYANPVDIKGQQFVDGGVSAAIPVQQAWRDEARSIVVIRTEPLECEMEPNESNDIPSTIAPVEWYRESLNQLQLQWQNRVDQWKMDWLGFLQSRIAASTLNEQFKSLNGGRWLFGAGELYRLNHLLGDKFDSSLADMLMVHYQTYSLTQQFMESPPDDVFIVQIAPSDELKSSSLMSSKEDLMHDYQLGLDAGNRFVDLYLQTQTKIAHKVS
ncbi:patatin-like phospholipase family protein [Vibrio maerlii]|uniref:patatin-like phospholipase family protein n=1 Tax=Vibrio maerlii TaxID=2231648 RepID=UPI000E3EE2A1|nr:patatin-like phospholipase family protein [Vibrio maerlii]